MDKINHMQEQDDSFLDQLGRCEMKIRGFRYQLKKNIGEAEMENGNAKKANRFLQLFAFYEKEMIPALMETIYIGKKHLELAKKNPDKSFNPAKIEFKDHQKLIKQFCGRFDEIEHEFESFLNNS